VIGLVGSGKSGGLGGGRVTALPQVVVVITCVSCSPWRATAAQGQVIRQELRRSEPALYANL
jgi:hypothetical protein